MKLHVLYQSDDLLGVDKPAGMLVHRGWDKDPVVLTDLVKQFLEVKTVHPLHRLDRQTSGVILFARNREIASQMSALFQTGLIQKTYLALVRGVCPESGTIDHPVPQKEKGERVDAVSEFRRLATAETEPRHVSLVQVFPKTGRLHQIRRHMKHINHPLIGDANYGKGDLNRAFKKQYDLHRMALHCQSLSFSHPLTDQYIEISAPLPNDLVTPFVNMGFSSSLLQKHTQ